MSDSTGKYTAAYLLKEGANLVLDKPAFLTSVGRVAKTYVELFKAARGAKNPPLCPKLGE